MMSKIFRLFFYCDKCPNFDSTFEDCVELDRKIFKDKSTNHPIPKDCPLEDYPTEYST